MTEEKEALEEFIEGDGGKELVEAVQEKSRGGTVRVGIDTEALLKAMEGRIAVEDAVVTEVEHDERIDSILDAQERFRQAKEFEITSNSAISDLGIRAHTEEQAQNEANRAARRAYVKQSKASRHRGLKSGDKTAKAKAKKKQRKKMKKRGR